MWYKQVLAQFGGGVDFSGETQAKDSLDSSSDFEIDNFIELQKERTPTKYNYSHIFIENIIDGSDDVDVVCMLGAE